MKWISTILFWTTVAIFGTWLWEYGLILVAPVDFEIITWFGFAWMPDPAGGAGRTFKSRMCTLIISMQMGLSKREAGLIWALLGRGEGQTHMTILIILRWQVGTSRLLSLKMSLKTTKPFENTFSNKKLSFQFACRERGLIFQVTLGPPRQKKIIFFSSGKLEPTATWFGRKTSGQKGPQIKKNNAGVINWKITGGASQGKRFHLVTLGPPRQGEAKHTW